MIRVILLELLNALNDLSEIIIGNFFLERTFR